MQSVRHGFHDDGLVPVGDQPVQLRAGQPVVEGRGGELNSRKPLARLAHGRALTENPRDEFKLRHIFPALDDLTIGRVADEIQPGHTQARFVDRVVIQRIAVGHVSHADHRIALLRRGSMAKGQRVISRRDDDFVAIGKLIVQRSSEIKILRLISRSRAHARASLALDDSILAYPVSSVKPAAFSIR